MKWVFALAGTLAFGGNVFALGETVQQVLARYNVPPSLRPASELGRNVVNYAVYESPSDFAIAYYEAGSNLLKSPLHLDRYDRAAKRWQTTQLREVRLFPHSSREWCLRSEMQVEHHGNYWFVETHINPSAACELVFDDELRFRKALYGWSIGGFRSGEIVLQHSEVHFAPTHPLELSVYDPLRDVITKIYPIPDDASRRSMVEQIRPTLDQAWCREHNHHCDPELMDADVKEMAIDDQSRALAFTVETDASGYGPRAAGIAKMRATYVCRLTPGGIEHLSFPAEELTTRTGVRDLRELVSAAVIERIFSAH